MKKTIGGVVTVVVIVVAAILLLMSSVRVPAGYIAWLYCRTVQYVGWSKRRYSYTRMAFKVTNCKNDTLLGES